MKPKLSKFELTIFALFAVTALAGIGAYFYFGSQLETLTEEAQQESEKYKKLTGRPNVPSEKNIQSLKEFNGMRRDTLNAIRDKLVGSSGQISAVVEKDPVIFKQDLGDKAKLISQQAKAQNVALPNGFYMAMSRYISENPSKTSTVVLGRQLLGVEQLAAKLFGARVQKIEALQRTFDEDGAASTMPTGGGAASLAGEQIKGHVLETPLYRIYPFQVEFVCNTASLRRFESSLAEPPFIFITRSLQIANLRPVPAKIEDLAKGGTTDASGAARASSKVPRFVLGDELMRVRARIDLIEWTGPLAATAPDEKAKTK